MRSATEEVEMIVNYGIAILNAQSEEELMVIKQEFIMSMKEMGYSDTDIQSIIVNVDERVSSIEINSELGTLESAQNNNSNLGQGVFFEGLGLTAIMAVLAFKKAMLKKQSKEEKDSIKL